MEERRAVGGSREPEEAGAEGLGRFDDDEGAEEPAGRGRRLVVPAGDDSFEGPGVDDEAAEASPPLTDGGSSVTGELRLSRERLVAAPQLEVNDLLSAFDMLQQARRGKVVVERGPGRRQPNSGRRRTPVVKGAVDLTHSSSATILAQERLKCMIYVQSDLLVIWRRGGVI